MAKLEKYLFYLLFFTIPFQTREVLWHSGWLFNEWTSASLYATDLLFFILILFCVYNNRGKFKISLKDFKIHDYFLFAFIIIALISIKNAGDTTVAWFAWFKLAEFAGFYFYLSRYAIGKFGITSLFASVFVGGVFQSVIAVAQYYKQSSLGLKYFGESVLNYDLSGVASFYLPSGEKIIRAYGTTPHPNVLAVYLLLSLFAFYYIYLYSRLDDRGSSPSGYGKYFIMAHGLVLFSLFTTFSRVVIFAWLASFFVRAVIILFVKKYRLIFGTKEARIRIARIILTAGFVIAVFFAINYAEIMSRSVIKPGDQAVELRVFYAKEALGADYSLTGVGIGNFVEWLKNKEPFMLRYAYQPVHNIYLLVYSETGILGIIAFSGFIFFLTLNFLFMTKLGRGRDLPVFIFFLSVIFVGLFDHMFWTLQQGRFVFWIALALLAYTGDIRNTGLTFWVFNDIINYHSTFRLFRR